MGHANDPSLGRRLTELADELSGVMYSLVGNSVDDWIKAIKKVRNDLTHLDEGRETYDGADLLCLAESLFNVTRLCLLLRTGLDREHLPRIANSIRYKGTFVRVERAVERIAARRRTR